MDMPWLRQQIHARARPYATADVLCAKDPISYLLVPERDAHIETHKITLASGACASFAESWVEAGIRDAQVTAATAVEMIHSAVSS